MSKVIVIEHEKSAAERHERTLIEAGFEVQLTSCVISAIEHIQMGDTPDLIFCRDDIPGLDALDLLEVRREDASLSEIPVIVYGEEADRKLDLYKLGCDDFILFPVEAEEIVVRLKSVNRREAKHGMGGDFEQVNALDIIQMLVSARKSGTLRIEFSDNSGVLGFEEGQVNYAKSKTKVGEDAFLEILRQTQSGGTFSFSASERVEDEPNIEKRTDHLLLGLANLIDEESMGGIG